MSMCTCSPCAGEHFFSGFVNDSYAVFSHSLEEGWAGMEAGEEIFSVAVYGGDVECADTVAITYG